MGRGQTSSYACLSGSGTRGGAYLCLAGVTQREKEEGCSCYLMLCTQTLVLETMIFILF